MIARCVILARSRRRAGNGSARLMNDKVLRRIASGAERRKSRRLARRAVAHGSVYASSVENAFRAQRGCALGLQRNGALGARRRHAGLLHRGRRAGPRRRLARFSARGARARGADARLQRGGERRLRVLWPNAAPKFSRRALSLARPEEGAVPDEREPHVDLKPDVKHFPQVDRRHKGDPVVAMRPGFETRRPQPANLGLSESPPLSFGLEGKSTRPTETPLAPRGKTPGDEALEEADAGSAPEPATTQKSMAAASPAQSSSISTPTGGRRAPRPRAGGADRTRPSWRNPADAARRRAGLLDAGAAGRRAHRSVVFPRRDAGAVDARHRR